MSHEKHHQMYISDEVKIVWRSFMWCWIIFGLSNQFDCYIVKIIVSDCCVWLCQPSATTKGKPLTEMNDEWMMNGRRRADSHSGLLISSHLSGQSLDSLPPRDGLNEGWLYLLVVKWIADILLPTSHTALDLLDPRCGAAEPPRPADPWPVHSSIRY